MSGVCYNFFWRYDMKILCCHPSGLMYTEIYLRLEPLGVELAAQAALRAGHEVRILDLQVFSHKDYFKALDQWHPDAICFGLNYLANIPEVIDLAKETKQRLPDSFFFVGGHSASFTAQEMLEHAQGTIDCVVRGEADQIEALLSAAMDDRKRIHMLPGVVTREGEGPAPKMADDLDRLTPAHDLLPKRRKYFMGSLDPSASIEFTRGCPWNCNFCSAWIFYSRTYRKRNVEAIGEELERLEEPNVFVVDDVAFIDPQHGFAIGQEIEKRGIRKQFYIETRADVLLRNKEVFQYWKSLGLAFMFVGMEAIDEEELKSFRKGVSLTRSFEALEYARTLGVVVATNIIADPSWDEGHFRKVREWALSVPEVVNVSINTPYPGTENFLSAGNTLSTRDYRLFDIQHAVLPTKMPLNKFYEELVKTQQVLNMKHLGVGALRDAAGLATKLLLKGQTNFVRMLFKFNRVFNAERLFADHQKPVKYEMHLPGASRDVPRLMFFQVPA
jgi:hopanoid C-3 methylase HpnR